MNAFIALRRAQGLRATFQLHHNPWLALFNSLHPNTRHASSATSTSKRPTPSATPTRPIDENIPYQRVHLVDPQSGQLTAPRSLASILASIDRKTQYVELVSGGSTHHPTTTTNTSPSASSNTAASAAPIVVKIIERQEAFQKRKDQKAKAKVAAKRNVQKEMHLTWGAAPADLAHKLNRTRAELEKGSRVDVVFTLKKGQTALTPEEMRTRAQEVVVMMEDVGKEWRTRVFEKTMATLYLQGLTHGEPVKVAQSPPAPKVVRRNSQAQPQRSNQVNIQDLWQD